MGISGEVTVSKQVQTPILQMAYCVASDSPRKLRHASPATPERPQNRCEEPSAGGAKSADNGAKAAVPLVQLFQKCTSQPFILF
mmetsp:Transcript_114474/g.222269  ORF Transcript_114474/g.222269 Transcript_114474/m.222269 type:complete len:84 (+) Transcript_114474:318-569(+)